MDDGARWSRIERIFHAALDLEGERRSEFIRAQCGCDQDLYRRVVSLLEHDQGLAAVGAGARSRIGPYELQRQLGAGGMGEVYLARDSRLGRQVAVKMLPAQFAASLERQRRFLAEARAASILNHPNIVTVHDVGTDQDILYIVMEYVPGSALDRLIPQQGLKLEEALHYALQIAGALQCAHSAGIVHRDVKPANVVITNEGVAKVLDFGLAKLIASDTGETTSPAGTREGVILGTVAYMSPEQAEGKPVDARSDVFSFGSLLYEMLTGHRAFERDSVASTIAAILHEQPQPPGAGAEDLPPELAALIADCLQKDPGCRLANMREVVSALEKVQPKRTARIHIAHLRRTRMFISLGILAVSLVALTVWLNRSKALGSPVLRQLTRNTGLTTDPALSPDGELVAYASDVAGENNLDIWVRRVAGGEPVRLTRDPADEREPSFSPDGTSIAFRSDKDRGGIYVVPTSGGPVRRVAFATEGQGPVFSPDGTQLAYWSGRIETGAGFSIRGYCRISVVPAEGGTPRRMRPDFAGAAYPAWAPDGKHLLFLGNEDENRRDSESVDWWVTPLDGRPAIPTGALKKTRQEGLTSPFPAYPWALPKPMWHPDGASLVFSARAGDSNNLWRIEISPKTWKTSGRPQRLTYSPANEQGPSPTSGPGSSVRVAFTSLSANSDIWMLPLGANAGAVRGEARRFTKHEVPETFPSLSSNASKMVFISARSGRQEIWVTDFETGADSVLTDTRNHKYYPRFSRDLEFVSFTESRGDGFDGFVMPAGGGAPENICDHCGEITDWSPDGRYVLGNTAEGQPYIIEVSSRRMTDLRLPAGWFATGAFSPDGRWITFLDARTGQSRIALLDSGTVAPESAWWSLSLHAPEWSPDGRIVYGTANLDGSRCIWSQRIDKGSKRPVGSPIPIFHLHSSRRALSERISVGRDKLAFSIVEHTGNIWVAEWKHR
jgi:serine/threonine protein kinase